MVCKVQGICYKLPSNNFVQNLQIQHHKNHVTAGMDSRLLHESHQLVVVMLVNSVSPLVTQLPVLVVVLCI